MNVSIIKRFPSYFSSQAFFLNVYSNIIQKKEFARTFLNAQISSRQHLAYAYELCNVPTFKQERAKNNSIIDKTRICTK